MAVAVDKQSMKHILSILFAVCLLAINVQARQYSYCDGSGSSYPIEVYAVDINPDPVVSANSFSLTTYVYLKRQLKLEMMRITYQFHYSNGLSELIGYPFCEETKCPYPPIGSGPFTIAHNQLPSAQIPTKVTMQIRFFGEAWTCISFNVNTS